VNFSIRPVSDGAQYGVADFWSAPLATLGSGAGDCDDYAVLKYVALREAGIAPDDLRFLIVYYPRRGTYHVVVAVHLGEEWLILDNLTLIMVNSSDARHYRPFFVVDHRGVVGFGGWVTICRCGPLTLTCRQRLYQAAVCTRNLVRKDPH